MSKPCRRLGRASAAKKARKAGFDAVDIPVIRRILDEGFAAVQIGRATIRDPAFPVRLR